MKVYLREASVRHDHIDACLAMPETCDLVLLQKRVEALQAFLSTEAGAALLSGYRRAANILKAEEKKGWAAGEGAAADPARFVAGPEGELERELHVAIGTAVRLSDAALQREDFVAAMSALSDLRGPVDRFFEGLQVNAPEASVRHNRLVLLTAIRQALERVADFAKIEG
jgi:glycyl-tRNA synthetase beta chain